MKTKVWGLLWADFDEKSMQLDFTDILGKETIIPAKYEVCDSCSGTGVTTKHIENEGGGFTASEWNELDEDFREDYLNGVYDKPCPECNGKRVVPLPATEVPDLQRLIESEISYKRERESERRYGA